MGIETILLGASLATAAAGTGLGVMSAMAQGENAAASAAYQARVAENQAAVARNNANAAKQDIARAETDLGRTSEAGQRALEAQGRAAAAEMGDLAAGQGASGLTGPSQMRARDTLRFLAGQDRVNARADVDTNINQGVARVADAEGRVVDFENEARGAIGTASAARASGNFAQQMAMGQALGVGLQGASTMLGIATSPMATNWMRKRGWIGGSTTGMMSPMPTPRPR